MDCNVITSEQLNEWLVFLPLYWLSNFEKSNFVVINGDELLRVALNKIES